MTCPYSAAPRVYAILDTGYVPDLAWEVTCDALLAGGARWLQVRAKNSSSIERKQLVLRVYDRICEAGATMIVNDDLALAASLPGAGLHVGQEDTDPLTARRVLGEGRILGLSTHTPSQARGALAWGSGLLDYFAVGPVFATQTKPSYTPVGLRLVEEVASWNPALPWFAIGGVSRRTLTQVLKAGASRVVVVSDILRDPDPAAAFASLNEATNASSR